MPKSFVRKLIMLLITVLVVIYIGSQIYRANFSSIETETAIIMTASDSLTRTCYFIRDESVITGNNDNIVSYQLNDGEHINKDGILVKTYESSDDVVAEKRIKEIDGEIKQLNELIRLSDTFFSSPDSVDKNVSQEIQNMILSIKSEDYSKINTNKENLMYLISQRQIVTGKTIDLSSRVIELQQEKQKLQNSSLESISNITAPSAGYFSSYVDGYEDKFNSSDVTNILPEDLDFNKIKPNATSDNLFGKVCEGIDWYVVCNITAEEALDIKSISSGVTISIPSVGLYDIPVEIYSINQATKTSDAVLVLRGNNMNEILINTRIETVKINLKSYTGIKINKKSIHNENILCLETDENGNYIQKVKNVTGIYVLYKNQLVFKQIIPIYTDDEFIICDIDDEVIEKNGILTKDTVTLYDQVIIGGTDLYDGKIIKG